MYKSARVHTHTQIYNHMADKADRHISEFKQCVQNVKRKSVLYTKRKKQIAILSIAHRTRSTFMHLKK